MRFCSQKSSLTPGVRGSEIRLYRFGWSYSGKDVGLFSVAMLMQPCVFGNYAGPRYPEPWTLVHVDQSCHIPVGLQFGRGRRWSGGRSKQTAEQSFIPWFWQQYCLKCGISLEIRVKTILIISILESKAPSDAHWGGEGDSQHAWDSAHSACRSPDLLETEAYTPRGSPAKNKPN